MFSVTEEAEVFRAAGKPFTNLSLPGQVFISRRINTGSILPSSAPSLGVWGTCTSITRALCGHSVALRSILRGFSAGGEGSEGENEVRRRSDAFLPAGLVCKRILPAQGGEAVGALDQGEPRYDEAVGRAHQADDSCEGRAAHLWRNINAQFKKNTSLDMYVYDCRGSDAAAAVDAHTCAPQLCVRA